MNTELFDFVMNYGRFETDAASVEVVQTLIPAAGIYLANAGVMPDTGDDLYRLCLASLVLHWFDHRDAVADEEGIPTNLRPLVNQLKMMQGAVV